MILKEEKRFDIYEDAEATIYYMIDTFRYMLDTGVTFTVFYDASTNEYVVLVYEVIK